MKLFIVFYHPKNPLNIRDILVVAKGVSARLSIVRRPGQEYRVEEQVELHDDLLGALAGLGCRDVLVLETYGDVLVSEAARRLCSVGCLAVVVGAEDYGVPRWEVEAVKARGYRVLVARVPAGITGFSYNVVSALVMALYELRRSCSEQWREGGVGEPEF